MRGTRTRVKICGITRLDDALAAQDAGVDAVGFVFVPKSSRFIEPAEAKQIAAELSPFITIVGLFLDAPEKDVDYALSQIQGMLLQFHGQETADYCEARGRPYIKAIGMGGAFPGNDGLRCYRSALGFLLDSNEPGALGGTGHVFPWENISKDLPRPLILAGGLNQNNVGDAMVKVEPHAIDVSSGVEIAKGVKCADTIHAFMNAVREIDNKQPDALKRNTYKDGSVG